MPLPPDGQVSRYILTSAQNNTPRHEPTWQNLLALAKHYSAEILIGTYTYNQNNFGKLSVKLGKDKPEQRTLWYDEVLEDYFTDRRIELANGLIWCGEMNTLPTAVNPLAGFEAYSGRKSAIFPHAKIAMRSIATFQGEGVKLNYTTGTVTLRNYIAKREGLKAEFHHVYGGLLVEVDSSGNWWVRQLNYDIGTDSIQDLNVVAQGGVIVSTDARAEAIVYGDLHSTMADESVITISLGMRNVMRPEVQVLHDTLEGASINRHVIKTGAKNDPHYNYYRWHRGLHRVEEEFRRSAEVIKKFTATGIKTIAPDANHDAWWLHSWMGKHEWRVDPPNARFYLSLNSYMMEQLALGKMSRDVNMMQYAFSKFGLTENDIEFLPADKSFRVCDGKIELAMHGHLGPNGRRGTPEQLAKMGRKAVTAHTHSAGIYDGLYVAGTSSKLKWSYNIGPTSWTHSHVLVYPNGKRAVITIYNGKWRA
jgi:hypothetical protein